MKIFTEQEIGQCERAVRAWLRGDPVEIRPVSDLHGWVSLQPRSSSHATLPNFDEFQIRPAPAPPQPAPWGKPEHIPVGVVYFRQIGNPGWCIILSSGENGIQISSDYRDNNIILWSELVIGDYEHSINRETWLPCTHLP